VSKNFLSVSPVFSVVDNESVKSGIKFDNGSDYSCERNLLKELANYIRISHACFVKRLGVRACFYPYLL
jgi:hypothetical protein